MGSEMCIRDSVEARVSTESDQRRVERIKEQWLEGAGA